MKNKKVLGLVFLTFFFLSLLTYYKTFSNDFIHDDQFQILKNQWLTDFSYLPEILTSSVWSFNEYITEEVYYRPLMHVIFFIEYQFFGVNPIGYHLVNVFIHTINAFLIFIVLKSLFLETSFVKNNFIRKNWFYLAYLASLFFIIHPVNSEVVYWIAAVPELFLLLFSLLTFLFFIKAKKNTKFKKYSYLFFAFGLFFKESAIILVLFLFIYSWFTKDKNESFKKLFFNWLKNNWIYFLIFLIYFFVRKSLIADEVVDTLFIDIKLLLINLLFFPTIVSDFIFRLIWPANLSFFYSINLEDRTFFGFAPVFIFFISILLWRILFSRNEKMLSLLKNFLFFMAFLIIPLLLASMAILVKVSILSNRYLYLSSVVFSFGLSFVLVFIVNKINLSAKNKLIAIIGGVLIFAIPMTLESINQGNYWKNEKALFENVVEKQPKNSFARDSFSVALCLEGKCDECMMNFYLTDEHRMSGKTAAVTDPNYYLGACHFKNKNYEKSLEHFKKSFSRRSYGFFPLVQANLNYKELAFENMNKILSAYPNNPDFIYKAALLNCYYGLEKEALEYTRKLGPKPIYKTKKFNSCSDVEKFSNEILYAFE